MAITPKALELKPSLCPTCWAEVLVGRWECDSEIACPRCGHLLWFVCKEVEGVLVFNFLPGLVVGSEAVQRADELLAALGDASRLVLNLSHMRLVTSMFLAMLIPLKKRMVSGGKALKLCGLRPAVRDVFRVTGLEQTFDICGDEHTAVSGFAA